MHEHCGRATSDPFGGLIVMNDNRFAVSEVDLMNLTLFWLQHPWQKCSGQCLKMTASKQTVWSKRWDNE